MNLTDSSPKTIHAVLVGVLLPKQNLKQINDNLDELEFLALTAGAAVLKRFISKIDSHGPGTFIGTGKLEEIACYIKSKSVSLTIFDDELSGTQLRNIEKILECKVLDRTNLILDIFATRAKTAYAKVQVELAQYQYLLPRLTRLWTHLERQKGGIGLRGPGETELETDRRVIKTKISRLKEQLSKIDNQMKAQRTNRHKLVRVVLVGYTNVGKSTIMNVLSKSDVFAEDKLFATLDTTVRKIVIGNLPFLISDTVGFIRKLPHSLIEAFKSTLDEIREADLLLHVADISHPNLEEQIKVVNQTLLEIDAGYKSVLLVFNKTDKYRPEDNGEFYNEAPEPDNIEQFRQMWLKNYEEKVIFISAKLKQNIEELRELLYEEVRKIHLKNYPYDKLLY